MLHEFVFLNHDIDTTINVIELIENIFEYGVFPLDPSTNFFQNCDSCIDVF